MSIVRDQKTNHDDDDDHDHHHDHHHHSMLQPIQIQDLPQTKPVSNHHCSHIGST
jgi:hypothetical protein